VASFKKLKKQLTFSEVNVENIDFIEKMTDSDISEAFSIIENKKGNLYDELTSLMGSYST
jgi:Na+/phosphate symporter